MDGFPSDIGEKYRVVREQLAPDEYELRIPLRLGRGFVYVFGPGWYGVWLNTRAPNRSLNLLRREFPNMVEQQVGDQECTFRVPAVDLERPLEYLAARKRPSRCFSEDERKLPRARCLRTRPHLARKQCKERGLRRPESTQST